MKVPQIARMTRIIFYYNELFFNPQKKINP